MDRMHGGDWRSFREIYGGEPLDFSASVSPLGMPEGAEKAAAASLRACDRYPDPACRDLRRAIARRWGLDEETILCGSGASDLIDRLALALRPKRALIAAPTYSEYRLALERVGCAVREYRLYEENGFRLDDAFTEALDPELDLVLLCEPNNPTGRTTERLLLERIAERCDTLGILLVLDECFVDFLDEPEQHTLLGVLERYSVMLLRAFTKFYGMPGLRLGWCVCVDRALLSRMRSAGQPWAVSAPAQAAGLAALDDTGYETALRQLIRAERPRLAAALESCGCRVIPGEANYLLFYDPTPMLPEKLAARGILLRSCADFSGLGTGWYRTAIRREEENGMLIAAMEAVHT